MLTSLGRSQYTQDKKMLFSLVKNSNEEVAKSFLKKSNY